MEKIASSIMLGYAVLLSFAVAVLVLAAICLVFGWWLLLVLPLTALAGLLGYAINEIINH